MEITTFVLGCLGSFLGAVGTVIGVLAYRDGRRAARRALWSDAIEAVSRLSFDVTREDVGERLVTSRVRFMALIDGVPKKWRELGPWLVAEQQLGATLGRHVLETSEAKPPTSLDEHLENLRPWFDWNMALTSNLRRLQNDGYDRGEVVKLRAEAEKNTASLYALHGWPPPPPSPLQPLT